MLLLDVSNMMYTGASTRGQYFGEASEFKLHSIPYILEKIASYYSEDQDMIAVFEKVGRMPALATGSGYKSGRNRNPLVEWEIGALQKLLEFVGFPTLYVDGKEADHVIANYCRLYHNTENINILSADMDLACNVRQGQYSTKMLSYSTVSYNVDKYNFKEITKVEYNFMNINKILCGCSSDKILAFPQGSQIYNSYISGLESLWRRAYGYRINENSPSDFEDDVLMQYTTFEYFLEWYKTSKFYDEILVEELERRKKLIQGPIFNVPRVPTVNWTAYNELINAFNLGNSSSIKSVSTGEYRPEMYNKIVEILREAKTANLTMFDGNMDELEELEEVGDISNILGIISEDGEL